eukprot:SAG11_NODE_294_length_11142_cov_7.050439_5_plen_168_part_00
MARDCAVAAATTTAAMGDRLNMHHSTSKLKSVRKKVLADFDAMHIETERYAPISALVHANSGADYPRRRNENGGSQMIGLREAVERGDIKAVRAELANGANVNACTRVRPPNPPPPQSNCAVAGNSCALHVLDLQRQLLPHPHSMFRCAPVGECARRHTPFPGVPSR